MCLVVTGNVNANVFKTIETEVYIGGNLKVVDYYDDYDELIKVEGNLEGIKKDSYD